MAIDEAMLIARSKNKVPNTLRFFTWKPPAVTVGFFQSLKQEVALEKALASGIDTIRRYTGGGAVFHEHELTYSIVLSEKDISKDIIASYKMICSGIVNALSSLGLKAQFKPINDIVVNGKKISGNAQTRRHNVVLQHGTVLCDVNIPKMFSILKVPNEKIRHKMILAVEERVTSLKKELGHDVDVKELETKMIKGFEKALNVKFSEGSLTKQELKFAEQLYKNKYSTKAWNFMR